MITVTYANNTGSDLAGASMSLGTHEFETFDAYYFWREYTNAEVVLATVGDRVLTDEEEPS